MSQSETPQDGSSEKKPRGPAFRGGPPRPDSAPSATTASDFIEVSELDTGERHAMNVLAAEADAEGDTEKVSFGGSRRDQTEMDMTPMVDTVFLLLIFFMITAAFSLQKSLQVPTPRNEQASTNVVQQDPQQDPSTVTVRVDEFNTFRVLTSEWEVEAPSEQELLMKLREARQGDSQGRIPTKLLVMANGEAMHEKVVMALDAGSEVGMEEVQLMTVEEDE